MQRRPVTHGRVETLPSFRKGLKDLRCCDGDSVTLECVVEAPKGADVRWEKGGRLVPLTTDVTADFDVSSGSARLTISPVYPEDEGEYSCVAYNALGSVATSAVLIVDVPEEKENLLSRQLERPTGLLSGCSTPRSTPRTTPTRSVSPYMRALSPRYTDTSSRPKRLKVTAPKFYAVPHNRVAEEGETVRFQCAIAGHPDPWVTWDKNGIVVTPSARVTIAERDDLRVLEITEVTVEDAGLYRVTLENDVGRVEATARLEVIGPHGYMTKVAARSSSASPRSGPAFRRRLVGSVGRLGSRVALACDVRATPSPIPSWYRNGQLVVHSERVIPTWDGHTAMLEFVRLEAEDAGIITCVVENELGRSQCSAELTVTAADDPLTELPPAIVCGLTDTILEEGSSAEITVQIEGSGPLDVVWTRDGSAIPDCPDFRYVDYGDGRFGLRFADVFCEDSGRYSCEAFNQYGETVTHAEITIKERIESTTPVAFKKKPLSVLVPSGRRASFCAKLSADTQNLNISSQRRTSLSWAVGDLIVHPSNKYSVEEAGELSILHISDVDRADAGQVTALVRRTCPTCADYTRVSALSQARCACGPPVTATADLTVLPDNWASDTEVDIVPSPRCRGRSLSTSEIEVDLPRMGRSGHDDAPALLVRGPADVNVLQGETVVLSATYCGHPEPRVRWVRGGQEVRCCERTRIETSEGLSCLTITGITSDDSGKYVVSVENALGTDCHFASVAVEGPPEPPAGTPSVTTASPTAVNVTWSTPTFDGGHKLAGYIVEMLASEVEPLWTEVVRTSDSLNAHVAALEPNVTYRFRVRAVNIHGASEPSAPSDPIMLSQHTHGGSTPSLPAFTGIEPGDEFKARHLVQEELGKGRYGVVHRVTCQRTGQVLAAKIIKCIKVADKEKAREEIDIMNSLRHPKLLQLVAAFESPREMVMLMEYISGGELFERVVADDFQLTERDCILFMKQICEGVVYMHGQQVVHLDLKPENIMCQTRTTHQIKLIDFGLAQRLDPNTPVRVLFGTPEFVPPEIINYEPIGTQSDMWSVGVVCYVLLSGLSPFMGSSDAETFANVTRADFDFDDEAFDAISDDAKQFISSLLIRRKEKRLTAEECLAHKWMLSENEHCNDVILSTDKLKKFINRRKWLKTANAIRALGRMANLSASSRRNSAASSGSTSPRISTAGMASKPDDSYRGRICSERSDSGISDCSNLTTPSLTCEVIAEESDLANELNSLSQKISDLDRPDDDHGKLIGEIGILKAEGGFDENIAGLVTECVLDENGVSGDINVKNVEIGISKMEVNECLDGDVVDLETEGILDENMVFGDNNVKDVEIGISKKEVEECLDGDAVDLETEGILDDNGSPGDIDIKDVEIGILKKDVEECLDGNVFDLEPEGILDKNDVYVDNNGNDIKTGDGLINNQDILVSKGNLCQEDPGDLVMNNSNIQGELNNGVSEKKLVDQDVLGISESFKNEIDPNILVSKNTSIDNLGVESKNVEDQEPISSVQCVEEVNIPKTNPKEENSSTVSLKKPIVRDWPPSKSKSIARPQPVSPRTSKNVVSQSISKLSGKIGLEEGNQQNKTLLKNGGDNGSAVNGSVCAAATATSRVTSKRADFQRLQQRFTDTSSAPTSASQPPSSAISENQPRSRTSPTFQERVAFWQR